MGSSPEVYTFIPDSHARSDLLSQAVKAAKGTIVFIGDFTDGSGDEQESLRIIRDNYDPAVGNVLEGNHEPARVQVVNAALRIDAGEDDPGLECVVNSWVKHPAMGQLALASYGIDRMKASNVEKVLELYLRMQRNGFFNFLRDLSPIFVAKDYVGVHAGLTSAPLKKQVDQLDRFHKAIVRGTVGLEPQQLYSHKLAEQRTAFVCTDKTVITGHSSKREPVEERITAGGRRVRLGEPVKARSHNSMLTYRTDKKKIIRVDA